MNKIQTATIQTEVPLALFSQVQDLVNQGWFRSIDDIMLEALRRYLGMEIK
ncbi:MAG: hypothetical protein R3C62_04480 [Chloroflexota bacterium]